MHQDKITTAFRTLYGKPPDFLFYAPGRVNLIGEHIDYNGGAVFPCTINLGTYLAIRKTDERSFSFKSLNFDYSACIPIQKRYTRQKKSWVNYPLGIINWFLEKGHRISGLELLYYGTIPNGAGLSSSASVEVATAFAISSIFGFRYSLSELAVLAQQVENDFVGMHCGIMDQFCVALGEKDKALLIDCDSLQYKAIPFVLREITLLIIHTNKKRMLTESAYNTRREECEKALQLLNTKNNYKNLCQCSPENWETDKGLITDTVLRKRAKHVIYENRRVQKSVKALSKGDLSLFGQLMYESHESLMSDYEVSGKELDCVYEISKNIRGVIGCRMTGAGFGGCAVALVRTANVNYYKKELTRQYEKEIGYAPSVYEVSVAGGVHQIV